MEENTLTPKINDTSYNFSSRDSLGIESVAASISGELCPIVNTVTPRAFYWPFMVWIYYDFYKNSGIVERTVDAFDKHFLKHQDYFFVLSNIINGRQDQRNLVGKQITKLDYKKNEDGPYAFNKDYFQTRYGGMQYYNAGCLTMYFITLYDKENDKPFSFPRLTPYGREMALSFEAVIKDTRYYKEYRLKNDPVPKDVLEEYGRIINLGLDGFDECKKLLKYHLFDIGTSESRRLRKNADYLKYIYNTLQISSLTSQKARYILYDHFSPRSSGHSFPSELQQIIVGWELVIGRQYLTCGIEMIWKYMLRLLGQEGPLTIEQWMEIVIEESSVDRIKDWKLAQLVEDEDILFDDREKMISDARSNKDADKMVENGLKIAISVYRRFSGRDDLGEAGTLLGYGRGRVAGTGSLSFNEWISLVDTYMDHTVGGFLKHVMRYCIVDQHKRTCYDKLMRSSQSVNGFYFDYLDGLYIKNEHQFQVDFQGIRLIQLMSVMNDLDMFEEGSE